MKTKIFMTGLLLGWVLQVYPQMMFEASGKSARVLVHKYTELNENSPETRWQSVHADASGVVPENRRFSAPVKNMDPLFTRIDVNTNQNAVIAVPGGYRIRIGRNDLVDQQGNAVTGGYTLYFRDLTSPGALALSGVTMKYDSGGVAGNFQTAGMFELYAEKDGQALKVRQGQKIDIELPTPNTESGFNLYTFDEENGEWQYVEPLQTLPSARPAADSMTVYSDAWRFWRTMTVVNDTLSFDERWESPEYARTVLLKRNSDQKSQQTLSYLYSNTPYFRIKRLFDKSNRTAVLFQLPILSRNDDVGYFFKTFPELSPMRNIVWKYVGPLDKKGFSKVFVMKKTYDDIRIEYDMQSGLFNVILKSRGGKVEFNAVPYRGKFTESEKAQLQNMQFNKRYNKSLNKVRAKFDKKNKDYFLSLLAENRNLIYSKMAPEELAMTWDQWTDYASRVSAYMARRYLTDRSIQVTRTVSISGFGLVNCDKIDRMDEPVKVLARFITPDGKEVEDAVVMVIDGGDNSCLTLGMKDGACSAVVEKFSPTVFAVAVGYTDLYVVNASDVLAMARSQSRRAVFTLRKVETDGTEAIHAAMKM